jgi:hypothetical protein
MDDTRDNEDELDDEEPLVGDDSLLADEDDEFGLDKDDDEKILKESFSDPDEEELGF